VMNSFGDGKTRLVLNDPAYYDFQPVWGSDGRTILFSETRGPQALGWLMQFDYENRVTKAYPSRFQNGAYATDVDISPDMYWVAFEGTDDGYRFYVYLMTIGGQNRSRLTAEPEEEFDPVWRPLP